MSKHNELCCKVKRIPHQSKKHCNHNHKVMVPVCYTITGQLHVIIRVLCTVFIKLHLRGKINRCKGIELRVIQLLVDVELIQVLANHIIIVISCCEQYTTGISIILRHQNEQSVFKVIMNLLSIVLFMWIIELTAIQSSDTGMKLALN